ncbi:hypothetical protein DIPPA_29069 [Diplonema papillatum]|nr:hypothetical protein DIPPA_29069 [Diplonema papillatum]
MATCKTCFRMGYPLKNAQCSSCRKGGLGSPSNTERERGWRTTNVIKYADPKPLLGEDYCVKERNRHYYPFRRPPHSVPGLIAKTTPRTAPSTKQSAETAARVDQRQQVEVAHHQQVARRM